MPPEGHTTTPEDTGRAIIRDVERGTYTEETAGHLLAILYGVHPDLSRAREIAEEEA